MPVRTHRVMPGTEASGFPVIQQTNPHATLAYAADPYSGGVRALTGYPSAYSHVLTMPHVPPVGYLGPTAMSDTERAFADYLMRMAMSGGRRGGGGGGGGGGGQPRPRAQQPAPQATPVDRRPRPRNAPRSAPAPAPVVVPEFVDPGYTPRSAVPPLSLPVDRRPRPRNAPPPVPEFVDPGYTPRTELIPQVSTELASQASYAPRTSGMFEIPGVQPNSLAAALASSTLYPGIQPDFSQIPEMISMGYTPRTELAPQVSTELAPQVSYAPRTSGMFEIPGVQPDSLAAALASSTLYPGVQPDFSQIPEMISMGYTPRGQNWQGAQDLWRNILASLQLTNLPSLPSLPHLWGIPPDKSQEHAAAIRQAMEDAANFANSLSWRSNSINRR